MFYFFYFPINFSYIFCHGRCTTATTNATIFISFCLYIVIDCALHNVLWLLQWYIYEQYHEHKLQFAITSIDGNYHLYSTTMQNTSRSDQVIAHTVFSQIWISIAITSAAAIVEWEQNTMRGIANEKTIT